MWIVPVVLVVVGVAGYLLFGRGGGGILHHDDEKIPAFTFEQRKVEAESVTAAHPKTPAGATTVAKEVTSTLHTLYTEAFLDPANWRDGSYDEVWPVFTDDSQPAAQQDATTLTVGTGGGDTFSKIAQPKGDVEVRVLLDDKNQVATAVAVVEFEAVGTRNDGKLTRFDSAGQYFLRRTGDGWRIYAFDVHRNDKIETPSPAPSATAEAS